MKHLEKGRYRARLGRNDADIARAQAFRSHCFGLSRPHDTDAFDPLCEHILIEERDGAALVCCFRMMNLTGAEIERSYAAQYYDLAALNGYAGSLLEMGRFCIDPTRTDPDILRLAWSALTAYVDARDVRLLFGCTSFRGVDPGRYSDAFSLLQTDHLAPDLWAPRRKAAKVFDFGTLPGKTVPKDRAHKQMPPLLRTYLAMGAWVSDHAVIDHDLGTLHVFTGLEVKAIPKGRKRLLRAL